MKKYKFTILFLGILLVLVGCSKGKSTVNEELSKEDVSFTVWQDRTRNFGSSNYPVKLNEINKILKDKYQLEISSLINKTNELVNKEFSGNNIDIKDSFDLTANEEKLLISGNKLFEDQQDNISARIKIDISYDYLPDLKKVKLSSQDVEIRTAIKEKKYVGKDFNKFVKTLIKMMKLKDSDKAYELFEEKLNGDKKAIAGQTIKLYDSRDEGMQDQTFGKYLMVQFDGDGIPMNIFLGTNDYRK